MIQHTTVFLFICLGLLVSGSDSASDGASDAASIPTVEEFCDALQDAIQAVPAHEDDDEDFIDDYCDYIRIEHKLDIKEYDDLTDYDHLVVHYRSYKENKKLNKERNKTAKKMEDHGKVFVEKYGDTALSDRTEEELQKMGITGVLGDDGNDNPQRRGLLQSGCDEITMSAFSNVNPAAVNNDVSSSNCPVVYNQGASNSCWAFATTTQATCNYNKQTGENLAFSTQHLLDCSGDYQGTARVGGFIDRTSVWAEGKGFCANYAFAFSPSDPDYNNYCQCRVPMKRSQCFGIRVRNNWELLTRVVAAGYAVTFGMKFDAGMQNAIGNVVSSCSPYNGAFNHAMTIIGQWHNGYVLIQNSYGPNWGVGGKVWVARAAFEACMLYDYAYLNYNFFGGGYSAGNGLPIPNDQSALELKKTINDVESDNKEVSTGNNGKDTRDGLKSVQYYMAYMYGFAGFIIGIIASIGCGVFIYCVINCSKGFKLGRFKYKQVGLPSDTSDSDTTSINM